MNEQKKYTRDETGRLYEIKHSPITITHYDTQASILENGRVRLSRSAGINKESNEEEFDEIEIAASLIFKLASLLKATRSIKYLSNPTEVKE